MQTSNGDLLADPDLDETVRALADCTCRCVLYYRLDSGESHATVDELGRHVCEHHPDVDDVEAALTELHHVGLPKLETAGALAYDPHDRIVEFRDCDRITRLVRAMRDVEFDE